MAGATRQIAVLGSGIMGTSVALLLARRGVGVSLFDRAAEPFSAASRWNEGKIHLGYLYSAHRTLETARHILPGGLRFRSLVEQIIGTSIEPAITQHDDTYLIHKDSIVGIDDAEWYFRAVDGLMAEQHPSGKGYLSDLSGARTRRLSAGELEQAYASEGLIGGFRVPERSVLTSWIADRFVAALRAEPNIAFHGETEVVAVRPADASRNGLLRVETSRGVDGPFEVVVNALWDGRLAIDAGQGMARPSVWSHRFRASVFLRTVRPTDVPSTVIATGPFGDVKNYGGRDLYLSWYPSGLLAEGCELLPPPEPHLDPVSRKRVIEEVFNNLGALIPSAARLTDAAETLSLQGGWVYAAGQGSLADRSATIHRRDHPNIDRRGSYFSVDTAKYSIAPQLALQIADIIAPAPTTRRAAGMPSRALSNETLGGR